MSDPLNLDLKWATSPDRIHPIRGNENHGFYAGLLPDHQQALVVVDWCAEVDKIVLVRFEKHGSLLGVTRRRLPARLLEHHPPHVSVFYGQGAAYTTLNAAKFERHLHKELGFEPHLILVKAFDLTDVHLAVYPFPPDYEEFLKDPHSPSFSDADRQDYPGLIHDWISKGGFVFDWGNRLWIDDSGSVRSS